LYFFTFVHFPFLWYEYTFIYSFWLPFSVYNSYYKSFLYEYNLWIILKLVFNWFFSLFLQYCGLNSGLSTSVARALLFEPRL
jgi:hypothetical protein